jgi:hypothetical protein
MAESEILTKVSLCLGCIALVTLPMMTRRQSRSAPPLLPTRLTPYRRQPHLSHLVCSLAQKSVGSEIDGGMKNELYLR